MLSARTPPIVDEN